ncbi:MAG TPA: hypothetical protein VKT49_11545 [Bryobacteraceae bacterium]|nr:hypothetical protein [Bryobacteraceae bacterium]
MELEARGLKGWSVEPSASDEVHPLTPSEGYIGAVVYDGPARTLQNKPVLTANEIGLQLGPG